MVYEGIEKLAKEVFTFNSARIVSLKESVVSKSIAYSRRVGDMRISFLTRNGMTVVRVRLSAALGLIGPLYQRKHAGVFSSIMHSEFMCGMGTAFTCHLP